MKSTSNSSRNNDPPTTIQSLYNRTKLKLPGSQWRQQLHFSTFMLPNPKKEGRERELEWELRSKPQRQDVRWIVERESSKLWFFVLLKKLNLGDRKREGGEGAEEEIQDSDEIKSNNKYL